MTYKKRLIIAIAALLPLISACGGGSGKKIEKLDLNPVNSLFIEDKVVADKSYKIGEQRHAFVGEAVIKKKSYKFKTQSQLMAVPLVNASLTSSSEQIILGEGHNYPIKYEIFKEGVKYSIFEIPANNGFYGILFDDNGMLYGRVLKNGEELGSNFKVEPINAAVRVVRPEEVLNRQLIENYDLVFSGTSNNQLNFSYREYSDENLAKPAFFQDLTYPTDSKTIRYKNIRINIIKIDAEGITYEVLSD